MASLHPQRFCSTTPHFFKIILEDTSRQKLKIPKKFVMKCGKDLSSSACLKLPSGSEWKVELTRCKGKVWFEQGWPEFFVFCSLEYGSFLLFRYKGNSVFNVCIFDMSATEIDYPLTVPKSEEANEDDDLLIEDFQPSPCPPQKKRRTSLSVKADMNSESENTQPCDMIEKPITDEDSHCHKLEAKNMKNKEKDGRVTIGATGTQRFLKRTPLQVLIGNALALHRAYDFKAENPSFIISMKPSEIQSSLSLPLEFAKRHLIKQPASDITLQVLDGSTWCVEFTYSEEDAQFRDGWLTFVKQNNLEVGDACVFVLIKDIELSLRVVFFRTSEAINWFLSHGRNSSPTKKYGGSSSSSQRFLNRTPHEALGRMKQLSEIEKANAFKSDRPSCRKALSPSSIRYNNLGFPNEFTKRYLTNLPAGVAILRISDGRTWSVEFKYDHANSRGRLLKGWAPFVRDNNLKVGDVCVFTLINYSELLFEVALFPKQEPADYPSPTGNGRGAIVQVEKTSSPTVKIEPECSMDGEIGNKMSKISLQVIQRPSSSLRALDVNLEAANNFSSDNPVFKVTLGSGHSVHVPVKFSSNFIKQKRQIVMLQVKDTVWPVNIFSDKKGATSICGGWAAFAKENSLREGDVCIFELIEVNDIVLKIHIFRCGLEGESNVQ